MRWQHPERGLVFPDEFIPFAEHTGLIGPLTCHVLDTALAQARTWSAQKRSVTHRLLQSSQVLPLRTSVSTSRGSRRR